VNFVMWTSRSIPLHFEIFMFLTFLRWWPCKWPIDSSRVGLWNFLCEMLYCEQCSGKQMVIEQNISFGEPL
jgi:hypothetical protein